MSNLTTKGMARKRAPAITRQRFFAIRKDVAFWKKAGNYNAARNAQMWQIGQSTLNDILRARTWDDFVARKAAAQAKRGVSVTKTDASLLKDGTTTWKAACGANPLAGGGLTVPASKRTLTRTNHQYTEKLLGEVLDRNRELRADLRHYKATGRVSMVLSFIELALVVVLALLLFGVIK